MDTTKSSQYRLRLLNDILNAHLTSARVIKSEELTRRLGISLRQLRTDMKFLKEEFKAPLAFDRRQNGWFYEAPFVFIDRLALSRNELQQLKIALEMLTQESGLAHRFGQLTGVIEKIQTASRKIDIFRKPSKIIFFDPLPNYEGIRHLPFFLVAIENGRKTEFDYQAYHATEPKHVEFEPYFLRQWEGRWYVGGQSLDPAELTFIRVFPLERIVGQPFENGFGHKKPKNYDAESYFAHIYGITDPKDDKTVEEVILRFEGQQKRYFLEAPFFQPFDLISETDYSVTVQMRLKINIELKRKLATYGHEVTTLGPPRLQAEMRAFFQKALEKNSLISLAQSLRIT